MGMVMNIQCLTEPPPLPAGWLTSAQVADHLKISRRHLYNLRLAGMPCILLGTSVRFNLVEVEGFIRATRRLSSTATAISRSENV